MVRGVTYSFIVLCLCAGTGFAADAPAWVADLRGDVAVELAKDALPLGRELPAMDIASAYDPVTGRMQGTVRAAIVNNDSVAWPDLGFVLHANNARSYIDTSIDITRATVNGVAVEARMVEERRGVVLPLAQPLQPGAWVECELDFVTIVPEAGGRAGLLSRDDEAHHLYSWLPEPAVRGETWAFPALPTMSDPSFVRSCDYRWRLTLPESWMLVAGGAEHRHTDGTWLVRAPRTRNLVGWISDQPVQILSLSSEQGDAEQGAQVRVVYFGKYTLQAALCAAVARDTLAIASEAFGAYPRRSYDIVFTTFSEAVGGMEASGLTFIDLPMFRKLNRRSPDPITDESNMTLMAVIHEVMHSWWYDQVGNDTGTEPWLDEPLTEWSTWYVIERLRGREAMQSVASSRFMALMAIANRLLPLNSAGEDMSEMQFGVLLYCRGPMLYEALRVEVGDEALLTALRSWYRVHAGSEVTRADWDETFLALLPEDRRQSFAQQWIEGTDDPVPAQMDTVLPDAGAERIRALIKAAQPRVEDAAAAGQP